VPRCGRGVLVLVGGPSGLGRCSAAGGERADRVQDGVEVVLPWPAGWHPEGPLAAGARQSGRDVEQVLAASAGGLNWPGREADQGAPSSEVVGERGDYGPRAVGVHLTAGEMAERLVFEVADRELDLGVVAVVNIGGKQGHGRLVAKLW